MIPPGPLPCVGLQFNLLPRPQFGNEDVIVDRPYAVVSRKPMGLIPLRHPLNVPGVHMLGVRAGRRFDRIRKIREDVPRVIGPGRCRRAVGGATELGRLRRGALQVRSALDATQDASSVLSSSTPPLVLPLFLPPLPPLVLLPVPAADSAQLEHHRVAVGSAPSSAAVLVLLVLLPLLLEIVEQSRIAIQRDQPDSMCQHLVVNDGGVVPDVHLLNGDGGDVLDHDPTEGVREGRVAPDDLEDELVPGRAVEDAEAEV
mmetsp:Transcript_29210/g.86483  ORF Transcript_29210/g.86483 Transcript_29210/m.86483 type:complete len:258 (+) Transcript_29210:802-1575(+)